METFTDTYLGLEIHAQAFSISSREADVSCRIVHLSGLRFAPLTAEVMRVPGGPLPRTAAVRFGLAYCMGVIDAHRDEDDERTLP
ncbi:hypothetical protein [Paraburkholderia sp. J11-2]|uniref:hypothetical protein n=1 Tax=Paraburkholderia sp. J11-2 TaxID=2805431 RepID=UPI002AB7BDE3|nr:hypothetical protein [Paraburkholderia sp. J11-2]